MDYLIIYLLIQIATSYSTEKKTKKKACPTHKVFAQKSPFGEPTELNNSQRPKSELDYREKNSPAN